MTNLKTIWCSLVLVPTMMCAGNDVVVRSGETLEIAVDAHDTYYCAGGTTVKFLSSFPKSNRFNGHFILTNDTGAVTLDVTALSTRDQGFHLLGNIIASDRSGQVRESLQIKGTRKLYVDANSGAWGFSGWDVANVTFLDDDGNDVTASLGTGEGVLFAGATTVWRKPACRYEVFAGADIALGIPAADFGYYTPDGNNEIVLADKELYIIQTNLIDNTATIRVQPGRRFTFKPVTRVYPWSWSGDSAVDLRNPVVLESSETARSTLIHRSSKGIFIAGPVTGNGDFEFSTDNYSSVGVPSGGLMGPLDFTGTIFVHGNVDISTCAQNPADFYIATNCPGRVDNTLKIGGSTRTFFATPPVARFPWRLWSEVSVKTLEGIKEKGYVGELDAVAGQTVTVHRVTGPVRLGGEGSFVFEQIDASAVLTVLPSCRTSFTTANIASGAKIVLVSDQDGQSFDLSMDGKDCVVEPLAGVRAVTNAVLGGVLEIGRGQTYRIRTGEDFSYRLNGEDESWRSLLTFWVDPTNLARQVALDFATTNDNPHLEMIHDAREGQPYLLQNNYQRTAAGGQSGNWHKSQSPYMFLSLDDGPLVNGVRLPYLNTGAYAAGGARRFYFGSEGTQPYAAMTIPSKFVVMVVDASKGGGMSLIKDSHGEKYNIFARCACDKTVKPTSQMPIFTNAIFTTWVDGVRVDPTRPGTLKEAWQVISFRTCGEPLAGLGYTQITYNNGGGINYGDIMIFSEELTDAQRKDVERRLAAKWGITSYQETPETVDVAVNGAGTIEVGAKTSVAPYGLFRGTFDLAAEATLVIGARPGMPTAEDVLKIEGRVNWFDPEAEGAIRCINANSEQVNALYDRVDGEEDGHWFMYGSGSRYPWVNESSRSIGAPVRKWIDFGYKYADGMGNTLRYRPTPLDRDGNSDSSINYSTNVQTVCSVYDSSRLGTPFLDTIAGNGLVRRRESISDPIWTANTSSILKNGKQYLNGHEVDGTTTSFGGKAEVFSFTTAGDFPLMCMGDYQASQNAPGGVILGESIFFNRVLTDRERQTVEAYLSAKWLGISMGEATDLSEATVTGAGTVVAPDAAALPQLGEGFMGTVNLTNETSVLAFTLNASTVVNPLDLQGGTLSVPESSVAVSVAFTAKAAVESYKLMSWREVNAPTVAFALAADQPTGVVRSARYTLRKEIDGLYLDVQPSGTVVVFR